MLICRRNPVIKAINFTVQSRLTLHSVSLTLHDGHQWRILRPRVTLAFANSAWSAFQPHPILYEVVHEAHAENGSTRA